MPANPIPPADPKPVPPGDPSPDPIEDLKKQAEALKERIEELKKRTDMPVNAALGSPSWEQGAADGHLDRKDDDDET